MDATHDAMLWEALDGQKVRCNLCAHRCEIVAGKYGICRVRQNLAGRLRSHTYGRLVAVDVDPIEKKPLAHFLPGTASLSIATAGCNFQCEFCQNWQISQAPREGEQGPAELTSPEEIVAAARRNNCPSISYTYTEPTVFFELAYDTCKLAHQQGIRNCFVSNGYMTPLAVETIRPHLDAINVDLKAFREDTYRRVMKAGLQGVLDCLKALVAAGIWVEVTTLVVPGMNDSAQELRDIARFIAVELGKGVPWHVSRFHGDYKMTHIPRTPLDTLELAVRAGKEEGLSFVYCGNATEWADENTYCPDCRTLLIERHGFSVLQNRLDRGQCPACHRAIEGVWK